LILAVEQWFFLTPSGVCDRSNARSWSDQAANPQHPDLAAPFFSAADRPVLPLSFALGRIQRHADDGGNGRFGEVALRLFMSTDRLLWAESDPSVCSVVDMQASTYRDSQIGP
jgi:hypothetical protein